ncbi:MAG TPA: helix-turn-helix domain-containing protein [Bacteroidales bacterium]|nr:helix-turn-helix domain-containing protein [Bacteroidales bacterium]
MSTDYIIQKIEELNRKVDNLIAVNKHSLNPLSKWIDREETMRILKCSERTLQTLRTKKKLRYTRPFGGSKIFYLREDVEALFEKNFNGEI